MGFAFALSLMIRSFPEGARPWVSAPTNCHAESVGTGKRISVRLEGELAAPRSVGPRRRS